jgi:hypothetical protein
VWDFFFLSIKSEEGKNHFILGFLKHDQWTDNDLVRLKNIMLKENNGKNDRVRGTQMDAAGVPCKSRGYDDGIWNVTNDTTNTNSDCGAGG